jgi:hypothetical protein
MTQACTGDIGPPPITALRVVSTTLTVWVTSTFNIGVGRQMVLGGITNETQFNTSAPLTVTAVSSDSNGPYFQATTSQPAFAYETDTGNATLVSAPAAGSVWNCGLKNASNQNVLVVWDSSRICEQDTLQFTNAYHVVLLTNPGASSAGNWSTVAAIGVQAGDQVQFYGSAVNSSNVGPFTVNAYVDPPADTTLNVTPDPVNQSSVVAEACTLSKFYYPSGYGHYQTIDDPSVMRTFDVGTNDHR